MAYEDQLQSLRRTVVWVCKLHLDYCELICGEAPCTAAGPPYCYYTYPTCLDPAHYTRGTKVYTFSQTTAGHLPEALPYLSQLSSVATELRPEDHVTRRARITLEFIDDAPLPLANPDKTASNPETAGSFFLNLMARNPNAAGRLAEIWQGFAGLPLSEFRLHFRGVIEKMEWSQGQARLIIKDQLKLLDQKLPPRQGSDNLLTQVYNGGASMAVTRGAEFSAPGTVKIEEEYINFSGVSADTLTGCVPGRYGSTATSHAVGQRVQQVAIFAEPEDGEGLPADELFLTLLCGHGRIDPLFIATVDHGAVLTSGISESAMSLPVSPPEAFPETGIVRMDQELIRYRGLAGANLQAVERGAYGTTPASHNQNSAVLITRFSDELGRWMAGTKYRRFVEQPTAIKDLVNDLREQCLLHVWQAEDSTIMAKCLAPPFYLSSPKVISDETNLIHGSTAFAPGEELRLSRLSVHYAPLAPDPAEEPAAYAGLVVLVDAEAESADYFGEVRNKNLWANWIYREAEALLLASRTLIRFRAGAATFKFSLELKDDDLKVGDFVRVVSGEVVDSTGAPRSALFEVLKKERVSDNRIDFLALDTRLDRRYPVIAPPSLTYDYDQASPEDRERYGWIGNEQNRVGQNLEDGYYLY